MKRTWTDRRFSLKERLVAGVLSALLPLATMPEAAWALPHGGVVAKGAATLSYSTSKLLITQTTSSATFDWGSFNVRSGQSVVYKTPGSSSVSMNYIGGTTPSSINGTVTSNGILYFMNPNGLIFGSGSVVSAAGVMAFGAATPWGKPTGAVNNAGVLTATNNGTVALVGSSVTNSGTIMAPGGEVLLAAGSTVTPITATDGSSLSVATTGGGLVDDSGILSANTANGKTGTILLQSGMSSGTVTLEPTAVLDASAPNGGNGGTITVNGYKVVLDQIAPLNVSAPYGTSGTITIDPIVTDVGTASALKAIDASQSSYLNNSSVCIVLTANINLGGYSWTPLGNGSSSTNYFTGTFNGNGHVVSGYTIGTSSSPYSGSGCDVGFIGYLGSGGKVENLGVAGMIYTSGNNVGGIVGLNNNGTVEYSYNTGNVNSTGAGVGGVVGGYCGTSPKVEYSYNTGAISGKYDVGGVVADNENGSVQDSYNTGTISGSSTDSDLGGVVGYNYNSLVQDSYNTGAIHGGNFQVGGVIGGNCGSTAKAEYSYYNNKIFTGSGLGYGSGTVTGLPEGTSSDDLGNSASYSGWSFASHWTGNGFSTPGTWIIGTVYPNGGTSGISAPILVPDLPTATVTGNSGSSVYSGSTVSPGYTTTYTMGGTTLFPNVTVTTSVGPNAGMYKNTPTYTISVPTTQTSVGSLLVASGTWTIASPNTTSGSGAQGGITSTHFPPVAQTANLSVSVSGNSSSDNLSDTANSSSSGDSITLSSSSDTSLSVVSTGDNDTTGDEILSTQDEKP